MVICSASLVAFCETVVVPRSSVNHSAIFSRVGACRAGKPAWLRRTALSSFFSGRKVFSVAFHYSDQIFSAPRSKPNVSSNGVGRIAAVHRKNGINLSFADVIADIARKVTNSSVEPSTDLNSSSSNAKDPDVLANGSDRPSPRTYSSTPLTEFASSPPLQLVCGTHMVPHPEKAYRGGEDALFVSTDFNSTGVADGVGGWSNQGIDPGLFSRQLMFGAKEAVEDKGAKDPVRILSLAYKQVRVPGSSTACIIVLDGDERMLRGANLGDSGILVLRGTEILYRTAEQQHYFNCPFQLGTESTDTPESAIRIAVSVQEGDLVIMGTDGLWDNMYDQEVIEICAKEASRDDNSEMPFTQGLAERLAQRAHHLAKSAVRQSPFSVKARQSGYRFLGGKMDDVTVVVCSIVGADTLVPYSDREEPPSAGDEAV